MPLPHDWAGLGSEDDSTRCPLEKPARHGSRLLSFSDRPVFPLPSPCMGNGPRLSDPRLPGPRLSGTIRKHPSSSRCSTRRDRSEQPRARLSQDLPLQIRKLPRRRIRPASPTALPIFSTERDLGHDTLQEVARLLLPHFTSNLFRPTRNARPCRMSNWPQPEYHFWDALGGEFMSML